MEFFAGVVVPLSFVVSGYALAVFFSKLRESRELYKRATEPHISEYSMNVYRGQAKVLKPLLCTAIITGYIWISAVIYRIIT